MSVDTHAVFDEAVLREITAAAGLPPWELIEMFLDDASSSLEQMDTALASADCQTVNRIAHSVKSSAGSVGAVKFSVLARELELSTKTSLGANGQEFYRALLSALDEFRQHVSADRERLQS